MEGSPERVPRAESVGAPLSPSEQDILISRLVARIAELEEKLYKKELEAPPLPGGTAGLACCALQMRWTETAQAHSSAWAMGCRMMQQAAGMASQRDPACLDAGHAMH